MSDEKHDDGTATASTLNRAPSKLNGEATESQTSAVEEINQLLILALDVNELCLRDQAKIKGSYELGQRVDELRTMLSECQSVLVEHKEKETESVVNAVAGLKKALLIAKDAMQSALETSVFRNKRYKGVIRLLNADITIAQSKLAMAITLAAAKGDGNSKSTPPPSNDYVIKPGQEECLMGDKAFIGHGMTQSYAQAMEYYKQAADKKYAPAMTSLASMYREGRGCVRDLPSALDCYRKAAALADLEAIFSLGEMHEAGEGVSKNLEFAIEYYQQAANGGHLDAQTNLGYIYEHGSEDDNNYVPVDLDAAAAWYTEASSHGHAKAQNNLGYLYFTGAVTGTPEYFVAVKWFNKAAEQGNADAQNNLGICYESGQGVEKSEEKAAQYMRKLPLRVIPRLRAVWATCI